MTQENSIASSISYILSPISIAFYVILLFLFSTQTEQEPFDFFLNLTLAIFFLCIFPMAGILIYVKKGIIDIWVSDRKTRTPFYIIAIIGYIFASLVFYFINQHDLFVLSLSYLFVTSTIAVINLKTKISSHSAGFTGPAAAISYAFGSIMAPIFILLPVLIWSRLKLDAHTYLQLITGSIIGIIVTIPTYVLFY